MVFQYVETIGVCIHIDKWIKKLERHTACVLCLGKIKILVYRVTLHALPFILGW